MKRIQSERSITVKELLALALALVVLTVLTGISVAQQAGITTTIPLTDPTTGERITPSVLGVNPTLLVASGRGSADSTSRGMSVHKGARRAFAVGHSIRPLTVQGSLEENRETEVELWYPATKSRRPLAVYTSRLNGVPLLPEWDSLAWAVAAEGAREDAPIDTTSGAFPVIVFSHGNLGNSIEYAFTLENIASHGFVVVGLNHVNNTQDDVRIDFINSQAGFTLLPCFDGLAPPCSRFTFIDEAHSFVDRARDVSAVLDALPQWFGASVDATQSGIIGHSRGGLTALLAAGGSTFWGVPTEPRVKAVMSLAVGTGPRDSLGRDFLDKTDLVKVTVPTLLVAGSLDRTAPPAVSQRVFDTISSSEKMFVLIPNALHRTFNSGLCAAMQSSGAIAQQSSRSILDNHTARGILTLGVSGGALDFCGFETFTVPTDIRPFVLATKRFAVTEDNVPLSGLDTEEVKEDVTEMAVSFFGSVLSGKPNAPSFVSSMPARWRNAARQEGPVDVDALRAAAEACTTLDSNCP